MIRRSPNLYRENDYEFTRSSPTSPDTMNRLLSWKDVHVEWKKMSGEDLPISTLRGIVGRAIARIQTELESQE